MDILNQCNAIVVDLDENQRMMVVTQDEEIFNYTDDVAIKYRAQYHTKETGERIKMGVNILGVTAIEEILLGTYDGMIEVKTVLADLFVAFLSGVKVFEMPEGGGEDD